MPLSGGRYVAPHWVNNAAPALDADELQAMCDTIVKNQTEAGKISGLQSILSGKGRVALLSYVGTGTSGKNYPSSITAPFSIAAAIALGYTYLAGNAGNKQFYPIFEYFPVVVPESFQTTDTYTYGYGFSLESNIDPYMYAKVSGSQRTISWYSTRSQHAQLNDSGNKYFFLCFGEQ